MIDQDNQHTSEPEEEIDLKKYANLLVAKWPWIISSLFVAITCAFLLIRYTVPSYSIKAMIQVNPKGSATNPGEMLYSRNVFKRFNQVDDQIHILKSYPIVYDAIKSLNLDVSYYSIRKIRKRELYKEAPFQLLYSAPRDSTGTISGFPRVLFHVTILDSKRFQISTDNNRVNGEYQFGQKIQYGKTEFQLRYTPREYLKDVIGTRDLNYECRIIDPASLVRSYKGRLNVEPVDEMSSILTLSLKSSIPERGVDFINALIEIYSSRNLQDKNRVADNTLDFIDKELESISDSLSSAEQELAGFKSLNKIGNLSAQGEQLLIELPKLESERAIYEVQGKYYAYIKEYMTYNNQLEDIISPIAFGIEDPVLEKLILDLVSLQMEKKSILTMGSTKSPLISQINIRIEEIQAMILNSLKSYEASNQLLLSNVVSRLDVVDIAARQLPQAEQKLINIQRLLKLSEKTYLFLMEKRAQTAITRSANTADCKVVEPPMLASNRPIAPKSKTFYIIACLLGLFLPVSIIILKETLDTKISGKAQLLSLTNIPFLGIIPHSNGDQGQSVFEKPRSRAAEAFRELRSNLNFLNSTRGPMVILVTSSTAKEGKTFASINLAAVYALSGKKTVIVGLDLRKPKLQEYYPIDNSTGVSNYLAGSVSTSEIIFPSPVENLSVIHSGIVPPNPSELLMNDEMEKLIEQLRTQFDYIILDTPPIGLVTDAFILAEHADINLFVARQDFSEIDMIKQLNGYYKEKKLKNLSIILNDAREGSNGYGYGYYEDESKPKGIVSRFFNRG